MQGEKWVICSVRGRVLHTHINQKQVEEGGCEKRNHLSCLPGDSEILAPGEWVPRKMPEDLELLAVWEWGEQIIRTVSASIFLAV